MHKLFPGKIYEFFFFSYTVGLELAPAPEPLLPGGGMLLPHGVCVWGGPWWLFATPPNPQPPPPGFGPLGRPPRTPRLCLHARLPAVYSPLLCVLGEGGGPWGPPHLFPCLSPSGLGGGGMEMGGSQVAFFSWWRLQGLFSRLGPPFLTLIPATGGGFGMGSCLGGGVRSAPPPSPRGCHCAKSLPGSSAPSSQGLRWLRGSALILGIRGVCPPPRLLCTPLPKFSLTVRVWPRRGGARGGSHAPGPVRGSGL